MKLSYIWVAQFRNIKNQGFDFSSEFEFDYSIQKNFISVKRSERFIPNFFGKGIADITGIVGQNGAGKTNLLELINYVIEGGNTKIASPFFVVYLHNENFIGYYYSLDQPPVSDVIQFSKYPKKAVSVSSIFFSNTFDGRRHNFSKNTHDISSNRFINTSFGSNFHTALKDDLQDQIKFIDSSFFSLLQSVENNSKDETLMNEPLYPSHVSLIGPTWGSINYKVDAFDVKINKVLNKENNRNLRKFCNSFRKKISDNKSEMAVIYFTSFLLYLDFILNQLPINDLGTKLTNKNIEDELNSLNFVELTDKRIDTIHAFITEIVSSFLEENFVIYESKAKFLRKLQNFRFDQSEKITEGLNQNRRIEFVVPFSKDTSIFLNEYLDATSNLNPTYNIEWSGISSGHKAYLALFSRFFSILTKVPHNAIVICIDEGDLYFHPKWQVEFLFKLITVLPNFFVGKSLQLIITTHSPFLVSDLPKHNLLFLSKGFNGNCEVIKNDLVEGETFGGNIAELYIDAFFLNGNLISHFAASKINSLVDRVLDAKEKKKEILANDLSLINIIGEDLIKNKLLQIIGHGKN